MEESIIEELTPEQIAYRLFTQHYINPKSIQPILSEGDYLYIFEILITIYMEGIMILYNNLEDLNLDNLGAEHLIALKPWFEAIGFNLCVDITESSTEHYMDIKLRNEYGLFFDMKGITKNYHFFANPNKMPRGFECNKLEDIYAVFRRGSNKYYRISFKYNY